MDKYTNIAELKQNEREDEDYTILYRELPSKITIMAPRGGGIEPGTIDIADYLAGCEYTFYALFDNLGGRSLRRKTIEFYKFVNILKEALLLFLRKK
jgi:phage replication-related protein YjqB (UPF0714/DUF867 family)